jgi:hypothetical protein
MPDFDEQKGWSGRTVVVVLLVLSVVTVVIGLTAIRPEPGAEPVPVADRPFGPANEEDFKNRPLINKGETFERQRLLNNEDAIFSGTTTRPADAADD